MNTQLPHLIGDKIEAFLKQFIKVPTSDLTYNMPWERYYFHNFNSFFSDFFYVVDHLHQVKDTRSIAAEPFEFNCFSITLDNENHTLRKSGTTQGELYNIAMKKVNEELHQNLFSLANHNYQHFPVQYFTSEQGCFIIAGVYIKPTCQHGVCYSIFTMKIPPCQEPPLVSQQTKHICQQAYNTYLTNANPAVFEHIDNQVFTHYFGSQLSFFIEQHNFFKAWELTLFSDMKKNDIAQYCGYTSWNDWLKSYQQITALANKPIVRPGFNRVN